MKYSKVEEKPCRRVFHVELSAEEYRRVRDTAMARISAQADIPGFRKGKIPAQVLQQRFGKAVEEETVEEAINLGARQVLAETGLRPVTNPTVSDVARAAEGMTYQLVIELAPQVKLGEYRGLSLSREPVILRPEDVDAVLDNLRRRQASFETVERPARWGDGVLVDFKGTVEDKPFEGGEGKDVLVSVGSGDTMREMENRLVGHRAGDEVSVEIAYPGEHVNKELAGKKAVFRVNVKEVRQPKLPEVDAQFAKSQGDYDSVEKLRAAIAEKLREEREREAKERLRAAVAEKVAAFTDREVAPSLVEEEMRYMTMRGAERLARRGVQSVERLGMKPAEFREMFRPAALRAVREAFSLEEIAARESITVTDEDLAREVRQETGEGGNADKVIGDLKADGRWERLRTRLRHDRTLDWVIGQATIEEKEIRI